MSVKAGGIDHLLGGEKLRGGERSGIHQLPGQSLLAAAEDHIQTVEREIGHMGAEEGVVFQHLILAVGQCAVVQGAVIKFVRLQIII